MISTLPTRDERLQLARQRLNIALTPLERASRNVPVGTPVAPTPGLPPGPPQGFVANPAATNFGRLAQARTDVPAYVPANAVPAGISPTQATARVGEPGGGIDVRSYTGSMWNGTATGPGADQALRAAGPAPATSTSTLLPTGNPQARDAILRSQFPHAMRSGISALGNLAYNRPDVFNRTVAGTGLDPVMAGQRARASEANIAATEQGTQFSADLHSGNLAQQRATLDATQQGT